MIIARNRHGFTLVELLIVIVVIAILATISVVVYNGMHLRALYAQQTAALSAFGKAFDLYTTEHATFPFIPKPGGGPAGAFIACVNAQPFYQDCDHIEASNPSQFDHAATTDLWTNITLYAPKQSLRFNNYITVNNGFDSVPYVYIHFPGEVDCPQVGGMKFVSDVITDYRTYLPDDKATACRYNPVTRP